MGKKRKDKEAERCDVMDCSEKAVVRLLARDDDYVHRDGVPADLCGDHYAFASELNMSGKPPALMVHRPHPVDPHNVFARHLSTSWRPLDYKNQWGVFLTVPDPALGMDPRYVARSQESSKA